MKKLIPYNGEKILLKGLILKHRSKVMSIIRIFSRALVAKSRSHDNSMASELELKYTAWMANQDIELTPEEYEVAIRNHYKENDHHLEHFGGEISDMDLSQLTMYVADVIARASYNLKKPARIALLAETTRILNTEVSDHTINCILYNTAKMIIKTSEAEMRGLYENEPKKEIK